jgi:hypothetical protein
MTLVYPLQETRGNVATELILNYESSMGIAVTDIFEVGANYIGGLRPSGMSGARLINRNFKRSTNILLNLDEL